MGARSVLVLAELADAERSAIEQDCQNCNFEVTWLTSAETVAAKLISGRFDALVVHLQTPGAARACVEARKTLTRVRFPIMALADHVDDATFSKAFRVGVDDVIDLTASAQVSQRLAAIPRASWKPVARSRGEALIVDPDNARAEALARLLKEAGYLIKNARDEPSTKLHLYRQSIRLVVVDNSVQETARWIKEGNSKEWHPTWIVRARPDQMDEISEQLYAFTNASAVNVYLGDADVLYEANRLSAAYESRRAAAARLFHGTTVTFSTGAADTLDGQWIEHGSTYSIDVHEIAVRTLALPPSTELELSLTPPGQEAPITLHADVTQRRVFGAAQDQAAPPGFTARLSGENLSVWGEAIRQAGRLRFGPNWSASGDAAVVTQSSAANPVLVSVPKSSQPGSSQPGSSQPRSAKPSSDQPTSTTPTTPPNQSSQPSSSQPSSSQPRSSKPSSSQPQRSPRSPDAPDSTPPSSQSNRTPSSPDSSGSVPIARVRLVSATTQGGNRGTAPTLKSLHEEVAEMEALAAARDAEVPSTTPSLAERAPPPADKSPKPAAAQAAAASGSESAASGAAGEPPSEPRSRAAPATSSSEARRRLQPAAAAASAPARAKVVVLPTPAAPAPAPEAPKRKFGWLAVVVVLALLVGIGVLAARQKPTPAPPAKLEPPTAAQNAVEAPRVASPPEPAAPAESATPPTIPSPALSASALEAPATAASAEPSVSSAPAAGNVGQPPKNPAELAGHIGYLYVASPIDTLVFVQGKPAGKTNSYLEVFCGRRYLRLGSAPGEWQSEGVGFKIACQQVNQLSLRPTRPAPP